MRVAGVQLVLLVWLRMYQYVYVFSNWVSVVLLAELYLLHIAFFAKIMYNTHTHTPIR